MTPDQAAELLLNSAQKAYNDREYAFAAERFREFLAKFGGHKDAPAAHYGLALTLLDGPAKDCNGAIEHLQPLAGNKEFPDHPHVLYHLGLARRGLGLKELAEAVAKPPEAPGHRANAQQRFDEAAQQFAAAMNAFSARVKAPPAEGKEPSPELEWAARARCDLAEMQLRTLKVKEAQATAEPFLKDPALVKSRYRGLGLYYHGFASFLLPDLVTAGRSLSSLTPFNDPIYGTHARYLLARIHHQQEERVEAAGHYEGVIGDYAKQKQAAVEALKQPERFKNDPDEKARLEALVRDPPPDHVARSTFYLGTLQYEDGRFADALARLSEFVKQYPASPLVSDAQLRLGFCQVQLRHYAEALQTLQPLVDKEPRLADQALLWLAKAQIGAADPKNTQAYDQEIKTALDTLRRAAERAQQLANADADAKMRRGEILLELGDAQQLIHQHREAANTYSQVLNEKILPRRDEEILLRLATALHLAGDYGESDKVCARFAQTPDYQKSPLLPAIQFRSAENAYFTALAAEKNPNLPNRAAELARLFDEAGKRYQTLLDKFPNDEHVSLARLGLAQSYYRKGDLEKAREFLEAIPVQDRVGELAVVPYVQADCLLRLVQFKADDALAAGRLEEQLKGAIELLEGFVSSQPAAIQTPDALLKLGLCHQRLAGFLVQPPEKAQALNSARTAYEKLMQQFPNHELQPQAVFERAKCLAMAGDVNGSMNELRRFTGDPLKAAPIAPMALVHLATLLRGQNQAATAVDVLAQARQQHEANLAKDPTRAPWIAILQYHHGVALREAGKLAEARAAFDLVVKQANTRPEAVEAALRFGQCLKDEGQQKIDAAQKKLATSNLKPEESAAAAKDLEAGLNDVRSAVQYLDGQAEQLRQKQPVPDGRARMLYEAAWGCRTLAESEFQKARNKIQQEQWQKLKDEAAKKTPPGKTPPLVALPEVPLSAVPLQPFEQKARAEYQALKDSFPDLPLANDARFELAELFAERNEPEPAVKLLREALDKEPPPELSDKIHLRLGACLNVLGDGKALDHFLLVARDPKRPLAGQGYYRAGEFAVQHGQWDEAVKYLAVFRDQAPFQNVPGLTDRALLRLGYALGKLNDWKASREAYEQVVNRFGNSPWIHEARYGIGWAWQNQKEFDNAVNAYSQVATATATELGARAQLQIGMCRLEQKRYPEATTALLVVPWTYDYPELSAVALCEAARGFSEAKQNEQAVRLLERVIRDHPESKWAEVAKERLEALKKS
jgi:TolA-binding protein